MLDIRDFDDPVRPITIEPEKPGHELLTFVAKW